MHEVFKVLADAIYVQPTRGGRYPLEWEWNYFGKFAYW